MVPLFEDWKPAYYAGLWRSRNTKWYYCFILHSEKALFEGLFENLIVEISCDEVATVRLENGVLFEIARAALL